MKILTKMRSLLVGEGKNVLAAMAIVGAATLIPDVAFAQADPFANAERGAVKFRDQLASFSLVVGGIGLIACLMLGFFGKLNWKWVSTGIGVSFAIAIVPGAINWLSALAQGG